MQAEPIRDDILDIRHERFPDRRVFLGWTADGRAVMHEAGCLTQFDVLMCSVTLFAVGADGKRSEGISLLELNDNFAISTEVASAAIRKERDALARLGPLAAGTTSPALALTVSVECDGIVLRRRGKPLATLADMVCPGDLADAETPTVGNPRIRAVHDSPDGRSFAISVDYERHRTTETWHTTTFAVFATGA